MKHELPEALKLKEETLINYMKSSKEKQERNTIILAFVLTFIGFICGMIFLMAMLYTDYNNGVVIVGFLFGLVYYFVAFTKWANYRKNQSEN